MDKKLKYIYYEISSDNMCYPICIREDLIDSAEYEPILINIILEAIRSIYKYHKNTKDK